MTVFRARARAVDMLGRQQIASLPTALSELFKNSHDAYAEHAQADFFRRHNVLVVSDDGVGMDRATFTESWLTIATESKLDGNTGHDTPPWGMAARVQLGEKGIGRLAIGALGGQVLVVSKREGCPAVAALVNWKMFELPQIALDQVPVGLTELDTNDLTAADVARLKAPLEEAVRGFRRLDASSDWSRRLDGISRTLDGMPDDPYGTLTDLQPIGKSGTVFIISSVSEYFPSELESPTPDEAPLLDRTLHGFTDDWLGAETTHGFSIDFIDHKPKGDVQNLLDPRDFFKVSDFKDKADQHIRGRFDDDGHFSGEIRIFDAASQPVEIKRPLSMRSKPRCGPFSFEVGVVQGRHSESMLDAETFGAMTAKLKRLGGLYVYMNGVRVQPYGQPDVDYLEIEERRSKKADYYYFSYRRMFGAICLSSAENPQLKEKAGREGFTRSNAYMDFRRLLIDLLIKLAETYFRPESPQKSAFEKGRERLRVEDKARKERHRRAVAGRRQLRTQLAASAQSLDTIDFPQRASHIVNELSTELDRTDRLQLATRKVAQAKTDLRQLVRSMEFDEPEGFAPTDSMRRNMTFVERGIADVEQSCIQPAVDKIDQLAEKAESRLRALDVDEQERKKFIDNSRADAKLQIIQYQEKAQQALNELRHVVQSTIKRLRADFDTDMSAIADPDSADGGRWIREQADFEEKITSTTDRITRELRHIAKSVDTSRLLFTSDALGPSDLEAAADAEIVELRAQADAQLELVQLGMALAVVDHEFRAAVTSIRSDIRRFNSWAKKNPQLVGLYEALRRDFDHLDSYLTLLTPMQRRVRRTKTTIRGSDISRFLSRLFGEHLRAVNVVIRPSKAFQSAEIKGYASTFYPVFINLVDNSLHWIHQTSFAASNSIELHAHADTLVYRDSGPGIEPEIAGQVFDFGFTTKPGGRGLGLAIASQVLERAGWSISLGDCLDGAEFLIRPKLKKR